MVWSYDMVIVPRSAVQMVAPVSAAVYHELLPLQRALQSFNLTAPVCSTFTNPRPDTYPISILNPFPFPFPLPFRIQNPHFCCHSATLPQLDAACDDNLLGFATMLEVCPHPCYIFSS